MVETISLEATTEPPGELIWNRTALIDGFSSADFTNKIYKNVDPVLRHAVDQISVGYWL